mmetsp:Transcript_22218/g.61865  ORF Transcript_22218/g.61865 Transcript_22218/m.61865 type:complete len:202 (-) Transcript_22218:286-891(-)
MIYLPRPKLFPVAFVHKCIVNVPLFVHPVSKFRMFNGSLFHPAVSMLDAVCPNLFKSGFPSFRWIFRRVVGLRIGTIILQSHFFFSLLLLFLLLLLSRIILLQSMSWLLLLYRLIRWIGSRRIVADGIVSASGGGYFHDSFGENSQQPLESIGKPIELSFDSRRAFLRALRVVLEGRGQRRNRIRSSTYNERNIIFAIFRR